VSQKEKKILQSDGRLRESFVCIVSKIYSFVPCDERKLIFQIVRNGFRYCFRSLRAVCYVRQFSDLFFCWTPNESVT
jgi:hypothetical protein